MMLRPDAVVTSVTEVTPDFLRAHGARAVMVDLDDTLLAAGSDLLEPGFRDWLLSLRAARISARRSAKPLSTRAPNVLSRRSICSKEPSRRAIRASKGLTGSSVMGDIVAPKISAPDDRGCSVRQVGSSGRQAEPEGVS